MYREKERIITEEAKTTSLEQNAINLSSKVLSTTDKSLLKKDPSFVPAIILICDFESFVNKLSYYTLKTKKGYVEDNSTSTPLSVETFQIDNPPVTSKPFNINFRREETNFNSLETFIEFAEKDLFQLCNYNKIKSITALLKKKRTL